MTVTLPETGPLPVIVPDIERARNTPSPWRHVPRPTTLPPCPSWCDHDHGDAFGPDAIPVDNTSDGGPIWGLAHRREVVVGAANVLIWQSVDILADGTVVSVTPPDVSWDPGEDETPEAASDMASALLAARLLVTREAELVSSTPADVR